MEAHELVRQIRSIHQAALQVETLLVVEVNRPVTILIQQPIAVQDNKNTQLEMDVPKVAIWPEIVKEQEEVSKKFDVYYFANDNIIGDYQTSGSAYPGSNNIQQHSELPVMHAPTRRKKKRPTSDGQRIRNGAHQFNLAADHSDHEKHLDLRQVFLIWLLKLTTL